MMFLTRCPHWHFDSRCLSMWNTPTVPRLLFPSCFVHLFFKLHTASFFIPEDRVDNAAIEWYCFVYFSHNVDLRVQSKSQNFPLSIVAGSLYEMDLIVLLILMMIIKKKKRVSTVHPPVASLSLIGKVLEPDSLLCGWSKVPQLSESPAVCWLWRKDLWLHPPAD